MIMAPGASSGAPVEVVGDDEEYQSQMTALRERMERKQQANKDAMDELALLKQKKRKKKKKKNKLKQSTSAPTLSSLKKDGDDPKQLKKKRRGKKLGNSTNSLVEVSICDVINNIDDKQDKKEKTSESSNALQVVSIVDVINNIDDEEEKEEIRSQGAESSDEVDDEVSLQSIQERRKARKEARARKRRDGTPNSSSSSPTVRRLKSDPGSLLNKAINGSVASPSGGKGPSRNVKRMKSKGGSDTAVAPPIRRTRSNIDSVKKAASGDDPTVGTRNSPARRQRSNNRSAQVVRSTTTTSKQRGNEGGSSRSSTGTNRFAPKQEVTTDSLQATSAAVPRPGLFRDRSHSEGDLSKLCPDEDHLASSRTINDGLKRLLEDSSSSRPSRHSQRSNSSHTTGRSRSSSRARRTRDGSSRASRGRDSSCSSRRRSRSASRRRKGSTSGAALAYSVPPDNSAGYLGHLANAYNREDNSPRRGRVRREISSGRGRSRSRSSSAVRREISSGRSRSRSRSSSATRGQKSTGIVEQLPSSMLTTRRRSCSEGDLRTLEASSEHTCSTHRSSMNASLSSLAGEDDTYSQSVLKRSSSTGGRRVARGRGGPRTPRHAASRVLPSNSEIARLAVNPDLLELVTSSIEKSADDEPDNDGESPSRPSLAQAHGKQTISNAAKKASTNNSINEWLAVPFAESIPSEFQRAQRQASMMTCESSCNTPFSDSFSDLYDGADQQAYLLGPSKEEARAA